MQQENNIAIIEQRITNLKSNNIVEGDVVYYYKIHNYQIGVKVVNERKHLMIELENERVFYRQLNESTPDFAVPYTINDIKLNIVWKDKILKVMSSNGVFSVWKM